jgi:hypothetical protein
VSYETFGKNEIQAYFGEVCGGGGSQETALLAFQADTARMLTCTAVRYKLHAELLAILCRDVSAITDSVPLTPEHRPVQKTWRKFCLPW